MLLQQHSRWFQPGVEAVADFVVLAAKAATGLELMGKFVDDGAGALASAAHAREPRPTAAWGVKPACNGPRALPIALRTRRRAARRRRPWPTEGQ